MFLFFFFFPKFRTDFGTDFDHQTNLFTEIVFCLRTFEKPLEQKKTNFRLNFAVTKNVLIEF